MFILGNNARMYHTQLGCSSVRSSGTRDAKSFLSATMRLKIFMAIKIPMIEIEGFRIWVITGHRILEKRR